MYGLMPSALYTSHRNQSSNGTGPTQLIWDKVMASINTPDGSHGGNLFFDDYNAFQLQAAGKYHGTVPYTGAIDASCTIAQLATGGNLGVVRLSQDGSDNDEIWLSPGSATSVMGAINHATAADRRIVAYEARFRVSSVADDVLAVFLGLGEEGLAAVDTKADNTGALADKDYIGFDSVHANSGTAGTNAKLNFVYNEASGAGPVTAISTVQTMVADTWYKVGFIYDPYEQPSKRIKIFVDGVEQSTHVTDANIIDSTKFPDGEELNPLVGCKAGTGTASTMDVDWQMAYVGR